VIKTIYGEKLREQPTHIGGGRLLYLIETHIGGRGPTQGRVIDGCALCNMYLVLCTLCYIHVHVVYTYNGTSCCTCGTRGVPRWRCVTALLRLNLIPHPGRQLARSFHSQRSLNKININV